MVALLNASLMPSICFGNGAIDQHAEDLLGNSLPPPTLDSGVAQPATGPDQSVSQSQTGKEAEKSANTVTKNISEVQKAKDEAGEKVETGIKNANKESTSQIRTALGSPVGSSPPKATPRQQEVVLHDNTIVRTMSEIHKKGKPLPRETAEKAIDPRIRKELLTAVDHDELKRKLEKDEIDLTKTLSHLVQIASTAAKRSQAMGTALVAGARSPANVHTGPIDSSQVRTPYGTSAKDGDISTTTYETELTTRLEAALAKAESEEKTAGRPPLTPEQKALLREKLRTSLRAKLAAQYQTQLASASPTTSSGADPFTGQLKREVASAPAEAPAEESHGMGDVIGSTFSAFQDQQTGFAMGTAETEAAVNGFLDESTRALASDPAAGVLTEESPALFIRVNEAHQRFAKRTLATRN